MRSVQSLLTSITAKVALTLSVPNTSWADEPIPVVATFSVLGDMVKRIGGEHISLTTLVGADGDTHVYQPTPQAARVVAEADVLFINGLGFEGWLERLVEAAPFGGSLVVATTGIEPIAFGGHDDHEEGHEEGHKEVMRRVMKKATKKSMKKKLQSIMGNMALLIHMHGTVLPMLSFTQIISQQASLRLILPMPVFTTKITRSSSMKSEC